MVGGAALGLGRTPRSAHPFAGVRRRRRGACRRRFQVLVQRPGWDAILGAEVAGHYKRQPQAYMKTADFLGLAPQQCLMVAAHNDDLVVARELGFRTAFVCRPTEYGPSQSTNLEPQHNYNFAVSDLIELAQQLDC